MTAAIVSSRFLASVPLGFFPERVAIQVETVIFDPYGGEQPTWATVNGMEAIPAARSLFKGRRGAFELLAPSFTESERLWQVALKGFYPAITTRHRAVIAGEPFDIVAVEHDQAATMTQLWIRQVTT